MGKEIFGKRDIQAHIMFSMRHAIDDDWRHTAAKPEGLV